MPKDTPFWHATVPDFARMLSTVELKVPSLIVASITAVGMWLASNAMPEQAFSSGFNFVLFVLMVFSGIVLAVTGVIMFRRVGTSVNPVNLDAAPAIVFGGPYRLTRNPMYSGILLALAGWGFYLGNSLSFSLLPGFVLYMNFFQVMPEERALLFKFRDEYASYMGRVRRWF